MEHSNSQFPEDGDNEATMPVPRFNEEAVRSALSVIPLAHRAARLYRAGGDGRGAAARFAARWRPRLFWPAAALGVALAGFALTSAILRVSQSRPAPNSAAANPAANLDTSDHADNSFLAPEALAAAAPPAATADKAVATASVVPDRKSSGQQVAARTGAHDEAKPSQSDNRSARRDQDAAPKSAAAAATRQLPSRPSATSAKQRIASAADKKNHEKTEQRRVTASSPARQRENVAAATATRERKSVRVAAVKEVKNSDANRRKVANRPQVDDDQGAAAQTASQSVTRVRSVFEGDRQQQQRRSEKVDRVRAIFEGHEQK